LKRTSRRPGLLITLALALAALPAQHLDAQTPDHEELLRLHRGMLRSTIIDQDGRALERLALDNLLVIPPGGILETKAEALAGILAFDVDDVSIEDEVVIDHGNTAVVIATLTLHGEVRPVGRIGPMRILSVFVGHDGEWRLLARSLTPCLPVAVAAGRC
jgi:hypothetical protein